MFQPESISQKTTTTKNPKPNQLYINTVVGKILYYRNKGQNSNCHLYSGIKNASKGMANIGSQFIHFHRRKSQISKKGMHSELCGIRLELETLV